MSTWKAAFYGVLFLVIVFAIIATININRPETDVQEILEYCDEGLGIMTAHCSSYHEIKERYLQWKNEFPDRDKMMRCIEITGDNTYLMVIIYDTE